MRRIGIGFATVLAAAGLLGAAPGAASSASPAAGRESVVWVRFTDRGTLESAGAAERQRAARRQVSARSLERRERRGGVAGPLAGDLPVEPRYLQALAERGFAVRAVSRWLNAASVTVSAERRAELARLPFVAGLEPVARYRRADLDPQPVAGARAARGPRPAGAAGAAGAARAAGAAANAALPGEPAFYAYSHAQDRLIEADLLHARGLSGRGVLVVFLDSGFRETHAVFDALDVLARRDFVFGDSVVVDEPGQDLYDQDAHGTATLSVLAGYAPGFFVGTAYGAQVALGKTEYLGGELPVEMDYWQMGAEWADSLGADVISSSLGYSVFDDPDASYEYADMNGHITAITRAAAEAARRGITVVTAQGNDGNKPWHYLIAPADAESVVAVGAVDSLGLIAAFSAFGPTADGRVKPDVCGMGSRTAAAPAGNDTSLVRMSGTSLSTPGVAGLVALLLEEHPGWGPFEVLEALRSTATRADAPLAQYGYGLARGELAVEWLPSTLDSEAAGGPGALVVVGPNPMAGADRLLLRFRLGPAGGAAAVGVFDVRGRHVRELYRGELPGGGGRVLEWDGTDTAGRRLSGGVYFVRFEAPGVRHHGRVVVFP